MSEPTPAELAALRAYAQTWDYRRAAALLNVTPAAIRGRLERWRRREGVDSTGALVWRYRDEVEAT